MDKGLIIVSGGTRGLGGAICERCLQVGYKVATFSRSHTDLVERLSEDSRYRDRFHWRQVDVRNTAALQDFVSHSVDSLGGLAGLVNNAGTGRFGPNRLAIQHAGYSGSVSCVLGRCWRSAD